MFLFFYIRNGRRKKKVRQNWAAFTPSTHSQNKRPRDAIVTICAAFYIIVTRLGLTKHRAFDKFHRLKTKWQKSHCWKRHQCYPHNFVIKLELRPAYILGMRRRSILVRGVGCEYSRVPLVPVSLRTMRNIPTPQYRRAAPLMKMYRRKQFGNGPFAKDLLSSNERRLGPSVAFTAVHLKGVSQ